MSIKSMVSSAQEFYVSYKLLTLIGQKYIEFDAYKLGLIDERGNTLRKSKTKEEKAAMSSIIILALNFKKTAVFNPVFMTKLKTSPLLALRESIEDRCEIDDEMHDNIIEAMVAGDSGGSAVDQAAGINSGAVVNVTAVDNVPDKLKGRKRKKAKVDSVESDDVEKESDES